MPKASTEQQQRDYYERARRARDRLYKRGLVFRSYDATAPAFLGTISMTMPVGTQPDCPVKGDGSWGVALKVHVWTGEHIIYAYKRGPRTDERKFRRLPEPLHEPLNLRVDDKQGYIALANAIEREVSYLAGVHEVSGF